VSSLFDKCQSYLAQFHHFVGHLLVFHVFILDTANVWIGLIPLHIFFSQ